MSELLRVAFAVPSAEAEVARAWLVERYSAGFEDSDAGATIELAVYTDAAGYEALRAAYPQATAAAVEGGWEHRWKEFHRPVVAGGLWIGPPWISPPADMPTVVVDPGRAFGTGAHPTTRACIELLACLDRGSLLDAGCGSGVVAVAASRLGFEPVRGVDHDEVAVEVAAATVAENGVDVAISRADVLADQLPTVDVVVANIELGVVERLLGRVDARHALTSGYLVHQQPAASGWIAETRLELDGWAADVLARRH